MKIDRQKEGTTKKDTQNAKYSFKSTEGGSRSSGSSSTSSTESEGKAAKRGVGAPISLALPPIELPEKTNVKRTEARIVYEMVGS
jgi:hypothetical protein